jgi:predicted ATPase
MLKRMYVDNYRCLANFEISFLPVNLLLGENGSGKSTVFDVIDRLRAFLAEPARVGQLFEPSSVTRWQKQSLQTFEFELSENDGTYQYRLVVEQAFEQNKCRVQHEILTIDGKPLFEFRLGTAQLYHDDHSPGPQYPFDWTYSGVAVLSDRPDNKLLTAFKNRVGGFIVLRMNPAGVRNDSEREDSMLDRTCSNFASWFRYLLQEHNAQVFDLTNELRKVMPGFHSFRLAQAGEDSRVMQIGMQTPVGSKDVLHYSLGELSDGQRALIILYTLLFGTSQKDQTLFLDEPENFLALPEIQPWLMALKDACGHQIEQAVLISHHPELINYLGATSGIWFYREGNGPTRVSYKVEGSSSGLRLAETVARGWQ